MRGDAEQMNRTGEDRLAFIKRRVHNEREAHGEEPAYATELIEEIESLRVQLAAVTRSAVAGASPSVSPGRTDWGREAACP